jgi:hypothetical protein
MSAVVVWFIAKQISFGSSLRKVALSLIDGSERYGLLT